MIKSVLAMAGLRVEKNFIVRDMMNHFTYKIRELGVKSVLDVGANVGQFAQDLRSVGYTGHIYSFEPLSIANAGCADAARNDSTWTVLPPMALGEQAATLEINVSHNLVSSSIKPVKQASVSAAPGSAIARTETVKVERLDDVVSRDWPRPLAMKIDTQGFELEVLRGAIATLPDVAVLVLEMSLVELYEGAPDFVSVCDAVEKFGYRCIGLTQGFIDQDQQELLQVDGLFVRMG